MNDRYSMVIRWSEEDRAYLVTLPELYGEGRFCTHGNSYEEAARKGREVMETLIETFRAEGRPLPPPDLACHEILG